MTQVASIGRRAYTRIYTRMKLIEINRETTLCKLTHCLERLKDEVKRFLLFGSESRRCIGFMRIMIAR